MEKILFIYLWRARFSLLMWVIFMDDPSQIRAFVSWGIIGRLLNMGVQTFNTLDNAIIELFLFSILFASLFMTISVLLFPTV